LGMTAMVLSFLDDAEVRLHCWKRSSLCERMHCFCESWMSTQVTCVLFYFVPATGWPLPERNDSRNCGQCRTTIRVWPMFSQLLNPWIIASSVQSLQYLRKLLWYAPGIHQCCLGWAGCVWVRCRLQFWCG
jgi:hypothetical protein